MAILKDGAGEQPSVRAVAARAGIGASTLRHYFPTQRDLITAVLGTLYEDALPDERIRDRSIPAPERLQECLWQMLAPFEAAEDARKVWTSLFQTFLGPDVTDNTRKAYRVLTHQADLRVASWLAILEEEGALAPGDTAVRTHFLLTVVDGLSIGRVLPAGDSLRESELATLSLAVNAIFAGGGGAPASP